jgi:hypothetical protein
MGMIETIGGTGDGRPTPGKSPSKDLTIVDPNTGETRTLAKGSCLLMHRGRRIVLENAPGKRIVSIKMEASRTDKDALHTASRRLYVEFDKKGAPAVWEAELLARWYDPSDSTVRFRLRIPHARYASWRENSSTSVSATRATQKLDDRLELVLDPKLEAPEPRPDETPSGLPVTNGAVVPAQTGWSVDEVRRKGRPSTKRQTFVTVACLGMIAVFFLLGGTWLIPMALPLAFMLVDTGYYVQALDRWKAVVKLDRAMDGRESKPLPAPIPHAEEWETIRDAVARHAPDRADGLARAEMRVRSLLEAPAHSVNPVVIDATARISNGLRDLVAAHRTPAAMATPDESRSLAERLADSVCALGSEAEDARLVAFRDAVFDFDTTTRYIESRSEPMLRPVEDGTART